MQLTDNTFKSKESMELSLQLIFFIGGLAFASPLVFFFTKIA